MEGGGVQSESELSSIAATFAFERLLRIEERVGVSLGLPDFLLEMEDVEGFSVLPERADP
jgi:hypothetical protein